jgi:drug/metabolite transporter (DMT)-like permease
MSRLDLFSDRKRLITLIAFASIYLIWGTTYLAIRIAVETVPPFLMAGVRFIIAGGASYLFLRMRGIPAPDRRQWRSAAVVGGFLLVGGNGLVTWSEQRVPSGIAALVVATVPIWMTLLGWLVFGAKRPNIRTALGIALGILGIGLLVGPGQMGGLPSVHIPSLLMLVAAPVFWSVGSLLSGRARLPENVFMSTSIQMILGGTMLLLAGMVSGETSRFDLGQISTASLLATFYLTLFGSLVALTAYVWLIKTTDPALVSTYTYVNPVIALLLGWAVLREAISMQTVLAMGVILAAVLLISLAKKEVSRPAIPTEKFEGRLEALAAGD